MVLTHMAWAAIVTSAQKVSYDLRLRRDIVVRASAFSNPLYWTVGQKDKRYGTTILSELRDATGR